MKIIITESQYRLINEAENLEQRIKDYIRELYNGRRDERVYDYPTSNKYYYPTSWESHYYINAYAKYPIQRNKLGLPANMGGMPFIKVNYVNIGAPRSSMYRNSLREIAESLLIISTKEALKPIMDKFNLDSSYIDKLKQLYVDTLSDFTELCDKIIWIDRTYTLLKGLKSSENKFDFWVKIARENGLMDGYVEELRNTGKNI